MQSKGRWDHIIICEEYYKMLKKTWYTMHQDANARSHYFLQEISKVGVLKCNFSCFGAFFKTWDHDEHGTIKIKLPSYRSSFPISKMALLRLFSTSWACYMPVPVLIFFALSLALSYNINKRCFVDILFSLLKNKISTFELRTCSWKKAILQRYFLPAM